jgi:N-acetylmuramoyl-L-alanine amidase
MRIIGPPSAEARKVELTLSVWKRSGRVTEMFIDQMFPALWMNAVRYHIDPVGIVAQSIKETGGGSFKGKVLPEFYNTCGLKIRHSGIVGFLTAGDEPLAHQMFPNWTVGAVAHIQHVCAYAGWRMSVVDDLIVDPRYTLVPIDSKLETWSELGGKWAPSPTYGNEIESLMRELQA